MKRYLKVVKFLIAIGLPMFLIAQEETPTGPWGDSPKPESSDETSLKIIDLHIKARGGLEALLAIKGIRMDGLLVEGIKDYKLETLHRRPNLLMVKSTLTHMGDDYVKILVTDANETWTQDLLPKRRRPGSLSANDKASLEIDARLPYLFLDAISSENVYAYKGETTFAGRKAYVIRVWLDNGDQIEALFDVKSFHIINYRQVYRIGPRDLIVDRVPIGLTRVENTWWEEGYNYRLRGKTFRKITYKKISFTPSLPPKETFKKPEVKELWLRGDS